MLSSVWKSKLSASRLDLITQILEWLWSFHLTLWEILKKSLDCFLWVYSDTFELMDFKFSPLWPMSVCLLCPNWFSSSFTCSCPSHRDLCSSFPSNSLTNVFFHLLNGTLAYTSSRWQKACFILKMQSEAISVLSPCRENSIYEIFHNCTAINIFSVWCIIAGC